MNKQDIKVIKKLITDALVKKYKIMQDTSIPRSTRYRHRNDLEKVIKYLQTILDENV